MFPPQDVCAFGHEVDAGENERAGVGFRSLKREFEGIAAKIGEFYDLVTLVMVAENDHVLAQAGLGGGNSVVQRVIRNQQVGIEIAPDSWLDFRRVDGGRGAAGNSGARGRNGNEVDHGSDSLCLQAVTLRSL